MKGYHSIFTFCLVLYASGSFAQNILTNGSFEQYTTCPNAYGQINYVNGWSSYTPGTPDYLNSCNNGLYSVPINGYGAQAAAQGNAYAGLFAYTPAGTTREYIVTSFPPLIPGAKYEVSMSLSLADICAYATNGWGIYFFDLAPSFVNANFVTVTPQVDYSSYGVITNATGWTRLSTTYTPDSAYDNLVVSNYKDNSSIQLGSGPGASTYSYYYIDSVVVRFIANITVNFPGALFCAGDTIQVPYTVGGTNYFSTGNVFTLQLSDALGSFASPQNIGSATATTTGSIQGVLPASLAAGTGYRVRIVSTMPVNTSLDNGVNIQVKPSPQVVSSSNSPVCTGKPLNLSATALSGSSYSWVGPGSFGALTQNAGIPNVTPADAGNYIVTATLNGCAAKDTVIVLVNSTPAAPVAGSNSPVCSGLSLDLNAASINSGVTYSWTGPGGFSSTQQNPSRTGATVAMSGNYTVTAILNGCNSIPTVTIATVNQTPSTPVANNNGPLCAGATLNLTAVSTAGSSYNWQGPGGYNAIVQNPVIAAATTANAGTYTVTAMLNGCTSAAGSTTVAINITTTGGAYASPNDTTCPGGSVTFVAMPQNAGTSPGFQWCKNGIDIPGATNKVYTTSSLADGDSVYCRMTVTGICATTLTIYTNSIKMRMLPGYTYAPQVIISSVPAQPVPNQPAVFTAASPNGGPAPQLQWRRNGVDVPGAVNATFSVNDLFRGESVSCAITTNDICAAPKTGVSNSIMADFPVGISNISKNGIQVYPNPLTDKLTIEGTTAGSVITISDITGRQLQTTTATGIKTELSTVHLPAGSYLLEIFSDGSKETMKLQKI